MEQFSGFNFKYDDSVLPYDIAWDDRGNDKWEATSKNQAGSMSFMERPGRVHSFVVKKDEAIVTTEFGDVYSMKYENPIWTNNGWDKFWIFTVRKIG